VRHGDAVAQAGRAERLAIVERFEDFRSRVTRLPSDLFGQAKENVVLARDVRANEHGLLGEDVGQFHMKP